MPAFAQGKRDAMRERGDAIMRRRGWGGASSSRLSPRLCFPGLLWMLRDVALGGWRALFLRLYSGAGGGDDDDYDMLSDSWTM